MKKKLNEVDIMSKRQRSVFHKGYWWLEIEGATVDDITINRSQKGKLKTGCPACKAGTMPSSLSCMTCDDKGYIEIDA